jgi:hypothetical protein
MLRRQKVEGPPMLRMYDQKHKLKGHVAKKVEGNDHNFNDLIYD